ncbi:MAG: hypothetical protein GXP55_19510 [Deltaproteobacteria bacterium]|nr:hypothetical protein [Deltaproteobacteria bacterium]
MPKDHVDREHLEVTGRHSDHPPPNLDVTEADTGAIIVVTQVFGPDGDNLVGISDVTFDGHPAVTLGVRAEGKEGHVHLSPIHGDRRKEGFTNIPDGTRCELFCPVSNKLLPRMGEVEDGSDAAYFALYLTPKLSAGTAVMVSDIWGHYHSRIVDDTELISYWASTHED